MRRSRLRARLRSTPELEITAFMNLMVVLVPFLLMTAVFTKMVVLELNLPSLGGASATNDKPDFELQITIRKEAVILSDNKGGLIANIPQNKAQHDYIKLSKLLKEVKARFPEKTNASILAEQDTAYDTIVQVMDVTRSYEVVQNGSRFQDVLFPDISIGDAPPVR